MDAMIDGSVENEECGVLSEESTEGGKCGVWIGRSVENAEGGKCRTFQLQYEINK